MADEMWRNGSWPKLRSSSCAAGPADASEAPGAPPDKAFGAACAGVLTATVERELERMGYRVARNTPYAGGYTTEHYGRPSRRTHALQIEINRALYMDEATLAPTRGYGRLKRDLERLTRALVVADWSALTAG